MVLRCLSARVASDGDGPLSAAAGSLHLSIKITLQLSDEDAGKEEHDGKKCADAVPGPDKKQQVLDSKGGHDGDGKGEEPDDGKKCADAAAPDKKQQVLDSKGGHDGNDGGKGDDGKKCADAAPDKKQQVLYGKPVSWCQRSRRWRDKHGRPPSPARPLTV